MLRPDLATPPLEWDQYLAWVRTQSKAGVAVLEAGCTTSWQCVSY